MAKKVVLKTFEDMADEDFKIAIMEQGNFHLSAEGMEVIVPDGPGADPTHYNQLLRAYHSGFLNGSLYGGIHLDVDPLTGAIHLVQWELNDDEKEILCQTIQTIREKLSERNQEQSSSED